MKAIVTRFRGPTNTRGSRIIASDMDGNRVSVPYDHASSEPHRDAAVALCRKLGWTGTLAEGGIKGGYVYVFVDPRDCYDEASQRERED